MNLDFMSKTTQNIEMPRGGKREGAGRHPVPASKRRSNYTIKVLPATANMLSRLGKRTSKGHVIEWFCLSPDAQPARDQYLQTGAVFDGTNPKA